MQPNDPQSLSQLMDGEWQGLDPSDCAASACRDPALQAKWARWHLIRDALHNEPLRVDSDLAARVREALRDEPTYSNVASIASERIAGERGTRTNVSESPAADERSTGSTGARESAIPESGIHESGIHDEAAVEQTGIGSALVASSPATRGMTLRGGFGGFALVASVALVTAVGINLWRDGAPSGDVASGAAAADIAATAPAAIGELASVGAVDTPRRREPLIPFADVPMASATGTHWTTSAADRVPDAENRLNLLLSQHIEYSPSADTVGILPYSRLIGYDALGE